MIAHIDLVSVSINNGHAIIITDIITAEQLKRLAFVVRGIFKRNAFLLGLLLAVTVEQRNEVFNAQLSGLVFDNLLVLIECEYIIFSFVKPNEWFWILN